jgi:hypothetical protein
MRLLLCLAEHAGEAVSIDDLLNQVWSGVIVAPPSTRRRLQAAHLHRDSAATRISDGGDGQSLGGSVRRPNGRTDERTDGLFAGNGQRTSDPGDRRSTFVNNAG